MMTKESLPKLVNFMTPEARFRVLVRNHLSHINLAKMHYFYQIFIFFR